MNTLYVQESHLYFVHILDTMWNWKPVLSLLEQVLYMVCFIYFFSALFFSLFTSLDVQAHRVERVEKKKRKMLKKKEVTNNIGKNTG